RRSLFPSTSFNLCLRFFPARINSGINKNVPPKSDQNNPDLKKDSCAIGLTLASSLIYLTLSFDRTTCFLAPLEFAIGFAELIGPFCTSTVSSFEAMVRYAAVVGSKKEPVIGFTGYVPLAAGAIVYEAVMEPCIPGIVVFRFSRCAGSYSS